MIPRYQELAVLAFNDLIRGNNYQGGNLIYDGSDLVITPFFRLPGAPGSQRNLEAIRVSEDGTFRGNNFEWISALEDGVETVLKRFLFSN